MNAEGQQGTLIPPAKYRKLVKSVQFRTIYFRRGKWSINPDALAESNQLDMELKVTDAILQESHMKFIQHLYAHVIPEGKKRPVIKIECDIVIECISEQKQSEAFWNTYKHMTLPVITVPFFREFVYNISGKMGIPPIIVPPWVR